MRRETVNVDQLQLWEKNPRIDEAESQMRSMKLIYDSGNEASLPKSRRQLMKLAESIAFNGYQNEVEPILTMESNNNQYIVMDANRRLTAIRLLTNPDQYKDILDPSDLKRLKKISTDPKSHIPERLEIVVFSSSEDAELREILERKHGGPLDGVGTVPWSPIAKSRFFGRHEFADKLEIPFQMQFGETLSSYLGGSQAITSTRRIFSSRPVQEYLDIKNPNKPTQEELDKVKYLADETMEYCAFHQIPLSRLNKHEIAEGLIQPLISKGRADSNSPDITVQRTFREKLHTIGINMERQLGSRYNKFEWIVDDPNFIDVNFMLASLHKYGELTGDDEDRKLKTYLLSPAIRSIYELALLGVSVSEEEIVLPEPVSKRHDLNVNYMHSLFKNNQFKHYLSEHKKLFSNYFDANSVINCTDFKKAVTESQLSAHKSARSLDIDQVKAAFNTAVLFALLCEHYVNYLRTGAAPNNKQIV